MNSDSADLTKQLHQASYYGRDSEVLRLLQKGAPPDSQHYRTPYSPPLYTSCCYNHYRCAEYLLKWGASVTATTEEGSTPLHGACANVHCVRLLLDHYSPTDIKDKNNDTAADVARISGHRETAELITNYKPSQRNPLSTYPTAKQLGKLEVDQWFKLGLQLGLTSYELESLKYSTQPTSSTLIAAKVKNIDLNWKHVVKGLLLVGEYEVAEMVCSKHEEDHSLLSVSVFYCWIDIVKYLVDTVGLSPKGTINKAGQTPLTLASACGHLDIAKYLINIHHCDPEHTVNKAGQTPLLLASAGGHLKTVKYLAETHNCDPRRTQDKAGQTPLSLASAGGHLNTVKYLAETHHCDPRRTRDKAGKTPLSLAYSNRHLKMVKYLVQEQQCNPNFVVNIEGDTPLFLECARGKLDWVKAFIGNFDPNGSINKAGQSPLSQASAGGHLDIVKYLAETHHCDPRRMSDIAGHTPLSLASAGGHLDTVEYLVEIHHCDPRRTRDKAGQTPLSLAYSNRHLETVNYLVEQQQCNLNVVVNQEGDTPLSLECSRGNLDWVKVLISKHVDLNGRVNKAGQSLLSIAYSKRHLEIVKYLVQEKQCNPNFAVSKFGDTALSLECLNGHLDWVKALINTHIDPRKPASKYSESPIALAYKRRHWEVVKYLVNTHYCDTKDFLLHAVENNDVKAAKFLLNECHSNPNIMDKQGRTLLDLANAPNIMILLLKHGAKAENVYKSHNKLIGNLSSERPPDNPLPILITGDGGVGKSTMLKSMLSSKGFKANFIKAKPVTGVDEKTVGIIPHEITTKEFGKVICYDFAGQQEFYASHCAILENAVQTSPPIIIYLAHLQASEQNIADSTAWWMTLVQNHCTKLTGSAHVIVVGSHADRVKESGKNPRDKESMFAPIIKKFSKLEFIAFTPMDCRFPDSDRMKEVKKQIQKSSAILRSPETVSLNAHTFYIYLLDCFKDHLAVSLHEVKQRIHSDLDQTQSKREKNLLSFIPSTFPRLVEICDQLNKKGLILYLHSDDSPEKSFIVCDRVTLLNEVTGNVFAPEGFRQHCSLSNSTGVVPLFKFTKQFREHDIHMLIAFMSHLEFCFEIKDEEVLTHIVEILNENAEDSDPENRYLFFPGLIRINTPERVWEEANAELGYHFGWILQSSQEIDFFDPRCLQVLILRIVFAFRLAPAARIQEHIPSVQRFCSVWKKGICWVNENGISSHLELANNGKSFILKVRCRLLKAECLTVRYEIITKVLQTVKDFCPNIRTTESIIDPFQVITHPLKPTFELTLCSITNTAIAIVSNKEDIMSEYQSPTLKHLLKFEPYANLDHNTLQCIHSDNNVSKDEKISNTFVHHFCNQVRPEDLSSYIELFSHAQASGHGTQTSHISGPRQVLIQALETWRNKTRGTYVCLRETLNKYSVFTARNPLELAGVPFQTNPENDLPIQDPTFSQPRSRGLLVIEDLQGEADITYSQLNTEIREEDIFDLAGCFDCVETYLDKLGLTAGQQTQIEELAERRDVQTAMTKALKFWRQPNPLSATYRTLLQILLDLKRGDVAVRVCQYIKQEVPKHKTKHA